jgi:neurofibromin 1
VKKFPESKYTAVGAFIFLRFFCPAIVAPEVEGLVAKPPSKEMRRGLLLIAKVVQNLANNVLFGVKEPYMLPLMKFLTDNIYKITSYLREISVSLLMLQGCVLDEHASVLANKTRRSRHQHWTMLLCPGPSRLTLGLAWRSTESCTNIGTTSASGWPPWRGGTLCGRQPILPGAGRRCWSP